MFRRFFDEGLAQTSYLLACERTGQAAIVDPRRDIEEYVSIAAQHRLTITHAIETHIHADFVSGARELAAEGAVVVTGPGAALKYPHHPVTDQETLSIGDVELTLLHTPGHTPEHVSILAREPGAPPRVFTGDTLFVGAVGRPDLLGDSLVLQLAGDLHDSLFSKLLTLPDAVEVYPGHGAGSLCGAGIGNDPHSTIGQERRFNPLLQHSSKQEFVSAVLADLPETPAYFARMKRLNREGPAVLNLGRGVDSPEPISPVDAAQAAAAGAWLIDLRSAAAYGAGHAVGAVNMTFGPKLGYWAGWIIPADARVIFVTEDGAAHAADARRQLLRVGVDAAIGVVKGGFEGWRAASLPIARIEQVAAEELHNLGQQSRGLRVLDVRGKHEWESGSLPGALHIPVGELMNRLSEVPRDGTIATVCEGGYRSSLAASLLQRQRIENVVNIVGGLKAWRESRLARF
jgi:hydroxyacylglutathione hydrolase